jgi:hypothetical protein
VHDLRVEGAPIRVVIAEDSALIREGIARLVEAGLRAPGAGGPMGACYRRGRMATEGEAMEAAEARPARLPPRCREAAIVDLERIRP